MGSKHEPTRRWVLAAIGGGTCVGTAGARQGDEDETAADEELISETGTIVRFESCERVRVRSLHEIDRLEVTMEWDGDSVVWEITEVVVPLTIDSRNSPWSEHEPIIQRVSVIGEEQAGAHVALPDSWGC